MKIILNHSSARDRAETPHTTETSETTLHHALKRRAQSLIKDKSIDAQSRAVIRYGSETNDPWLAELVRRADEGENRVTRLLKRQHGRCSACELFFKDGDVIEVVHTVSKQPDGNACVTTDTFFIDIAIKRNQPVTNYWLDGYE